MESLRPLPFWLSRWKKQNTPAAQMLENLRTCGLGLVLEKDWGIVTTCNIWIFGFGIAHVFTLFLIFT